MDNNRQNPQNSDNQPKMPRFNMNWLYIIVAVVLAILLFSGGGDSIAKSAGGSQEANYSDFKAYVNKGYAQRVVVNKSENTLRMYDSAAGWKQSLCNGSVWIGRRIRKIFRYCPA